MESSNSLFRMVFFSVFHTLVPVFAKYDTTFHFQPHSMRSLHINPTTDFMIAAGLGMRKEAWLWILQVYGVISVPKSWTDLPEQKKKKCVASTFENLKRFYFTRRIVQEYCVVKLSAHSLIMVKKKKTALSHWCISGSTQINYNSLFSIMWPQLCSKMKKEKKVLYCVWFYNYDRLI